MMAHERQNAQTSRRGWKPRKTSDKKLANDIAASIREHRAQGVIRNPDHYTERSEIIALVNQLLSANT
jgi:hypothetical protein